MMMDSPLKPPHQRKRKIGEATGEETMDIIVLPVTRESGIVDQTPQPPWLEGNVVTRRRRPE